jgi:ABC-2 type transport system permease protein
VKLLRREFTKLLFQKRTYIGWGGLLAVPLLMTLALYLNRNHHDRGGGPPGLIRLAAHNGLLMPVAAVTLLSAFLLPLVAAMVGSYQLAGEHETGTIKTWLMHAITRGGVLTSKWAVAMIYMAIGLAIVAAGAFLAGWLAFGVHTPQLLGGGATTVGHILWLMLLAYGFTFVGVVVVLSLALFFATLTDSSLTATIAVLVVFIVMNVLGAFSYFDFLKPYLFTSHIDAWQGLFNGHIDWHPVWTGLLTFAIYIAASTVAAWFVFRRKDINV